MTDQPIEPRERDDEPNPETSTPHPDPQPDAEPDAGPESGDDGLDPALTGSDVGSDTRAGSLQGGAATGSERDEAQVASDRHLAELGPELRGDEARSSAPPATPNPGVSNTGAPKEQAKAPGNNADAATG